MTTKRAALLVVTLVVALVGGVIAAAHYFARPYDHANEACDSWRTVARFVTDGLHPPGRELDHMVAEAGRAAGADARYTKLWSDMSEYRLWALDGQRLRRLAPVSSDCASI